MDPVNFIMCTQDSRRFKLILLFLVAGCWPASFLCGQVNRESLSSSLAKTRQTYQRALGEIAAQLDAEAAQEFRSPLPSRSLDRQSLFYLPINKPESGQALTDDNRQRWQTANRKAAEELWQLAEKFVEAGEGATAYQLLYEILRVNFDHPEVRRVLGYRKNSKDEWVRRASRIVSRRAPTRHSTTGWNARRYIHVFSEHYKIATTVEAEQAIALAEKLERWHSLWRQLYFDYWSSAEQLGRWMDGKGSEFASAKKHQVVFFAGREDYLQALSRMGLTGPAAEQSTGYYSEKLKTMFFYAAEDPSVAMRATWLQEQAHQLFQETGRTRKDALDEANIWAAEAAAMYFESMTEFGHYATFGGWKRNDCSMPGYVSTVLVFKFRCLN